MSYFCVWAITDIHVFFCSLRSNILIVAHRNNSEILQKNIKISGHFSQNVKSNIKLNSNTGLSFMSALFYLKLAIKYGLFRQTLHKKPFFQGAFSRGVFVHKKIWNFAKVL